MMAAVKYETEIKTVPFGNGTIRGKNLTPIFSLKEREQRKCEIEIQLFNVFSKYEDRKCEVIL